jgi:hypothetical protein
VKSSEFLRITFMAGLALLSGPALRASSGNSSALGYFPSQCSEVAWVDLAAARQFPWFVALKTKFVPVQFYRFENFISSPQLGLDGEMGGLYWAEVAARDGSLGGVLGLATGEFDRPTAESALDARKAPAFDYLGHTLYQTASDFGDADLLITFLDSDTVAFGSRPLVEEAVRVATHAEPSLGDNTNMMDLIRRQNNDGIFWSVATAEASGAALRRLLPPGAGIQHADRLVSTVSSLEVSGEGSSVSELDLSFVAATATPQDALLLSALFQAGVLLKESEVRPIDSGLADILGDFNFSANGSQLALSVSLKNSQMATLIEHDELLIPAM